MTNIVVLIKQVPDTWSERKLTDGDFTLDRESVDAVLDEINERAVEEALQIKEANGGEVTVLTAGPRPRHRRHPQGAVHGRRQGRPRQRRGAARLRRDPDRMGASPARSGTVEGVELVIAGNEATDGRVGAVPAIIAEYLGLPQLTHLRKLTVDGDTLTGERETDEGIFELEATLPAIVSVNEKINEPRFPSFKGIMAAKKKEITVLSLAEIGVELEEVGGANAGTTVTACHPEAGQAQRARRSPTRATAAARSRSTSSARRSSKTPRTRFHLGEFRHGRCTRPRRAGRRCS